MGVSPAIFESNGQRSEHYVPGVYGRSFNLSSPSGITSGNLCILGKSTGGKPFELIEITESADAQEKLVGGELLTACAYAFKASNTYIPQKVYAMRVNDGSQSSVYLASGATNILKVNSWDYGVHTNQLKILVSSGTVANSKRIILSYKDKSETVNNIINPLITLTYGGEGVNAVATVGTSSIILSAETEVEQDETPETIDTLTANFSDFDTIDSLITYINNSGVWLADAVGNSGEAKSITLDTVTSVSISDEGTTLYGNYSAFVSALKNMQYVGSVEELDDTTRTVPDDMDAYEYFTGGTVGAYTIAQWNTALQALALENIQIIATPETEENIHSVISTHCTTMSNVTNRKERTAILGGAIGMTDSEALAESIGLNNKLVSLCCDNPIAINPITGDKETLSGAMLGVFLAAMESSMSPNTPLTFKQLNVLGFSKIRDIANMSTLIQGGIMVCNANPENLTEYICIRALTTYQSDDLINNERSMVREDLFMNRDLRSKYRPSIGTAGVSANEAIQILKNTAKEWALNGYIVPSDSNENVWDIKVRIDGDKVYITYSRYLTAPVNFVFITAVNHIYTSTVEL